MIIQEKTEKIVETSSRRKRKATELWNAMVEEDEKQVKIRMSSALYKESSKKSPKLKKKHQKKLNNVRDTDFHHLTFIRC